MKKNTPYAIEWTLFGTISPVWRHLMVIYVSADFVILPNVVVLVLPHSNAQKERIFLHGQEKQDLV